MVVLDPTFEAHGWPSYIDLDFFNVCLSFRLGPLQ